MSSFLADEVTPSSALFASGPAGLPDLAPAYESPEDQDSGDVPTGVDEDALNQDDLDTDRITSTDD